VQKLSAARRRFISVGLEHETVGHSVFLAFCFRLISADLAKFSWPLNEAALALRTFIAIGGQVVEAVNFSARQLGGFALRVLAQLASTGRGRERLVDKKPDRFRHARNGNLAPAPFVNCDELRVGEADHLFNGIEFGPGHIEYFAYALLTSAYIAHSRPMGSANFATDPNPQGRESRGAIAC